MASYQVLIFLAICTISHFVVIFYPILCLLFFLFIGPSWKANHGCSIFIFYCWVPAIRSLPMGIWVWLGNRWGSGSLPYTARCQGWKIWNWRKHVPGLYNFTISGAYLCTIMRATCICPHTTPLSSKTKMNTAWHSHLGWMPGILMNGINLHSETSI